MESVTLEDNSKEKYRQFFQSLEPDGDGKIHVSTFKEFLKKGMGERYDDASASEMIAEMSPEVNGKISVDGLAESYSMGPRSSKLAFAIHNLLKYCPEIVPTPDLELVYDTFGIKISPDETYDLIEKSRDSFSKRLEKRFEEEPLPKDKKELKEKKIELMKMLEEQILRFGGTILVNQYHMIRMLGKDVRMGGACSLEHPPGGHFTVMNASSS
ncbi:unnamed protein product [Nezara viridula]|uniref:EF-hand domain-containing protein n=1 Tax=Nezara viridula TaxID=85310 RepID=A0A9P0MXZ5_NEZVI|nr:unnamed protein product [Nezara viridula]